MAGHARYTALLDACVLYPLAMTDALLSLATAGFFAAKWTVKIESEWISSLEDNRPDLIGKLDVRRDSMRGAVPDWEVPESAWSPLALGIELPVMPMFWRQLLQGTLTALLRQISKTFRLLL